MESVWFDFGNGPVRHDEETPEAIDAFIRGVSFATDNLRIDDYRQYDTEAEMAADQEDESDLNKNSV